MINITVNVDDRGHLSLPNHDLQPDLSYTLSGSELQSILKAHNSLVRDLFDLRSSLVFHLYYEHFVEIPNIAKLLDFDLDLISQILFSAEDQ